MFIQWCCDKRRIGENHALIAFPIDETANLIRRYKTHQNFISKKDTVSENTKPQKFTEKLKWEEWKPTFLNFLKSLLGQHRVPLLYVSRDNTIPIVNPNADMLEDYKNRAPLVEEAFGIYAAEVHTYIVKFVSGNTIAEAKLL